MLASKKLHLCMPTSFAVAKRPQFKLIPVELIRVDKLVAGDAGVRVVLKLYLTANVGARVRGAHKPSSTPSCTPTTRLSRERRAAGSR
eukprot:3976628-Pleurochrysis_carterae.AAC.2